MKKLLFLCCTLSMILSLFGYLVNQAKIPKEKYSMSGSVSLGVAEDESLDKTKVIYSVVIKGSKEDIESIHVQEPLINMEYDKFMLENGPHNAEMKDAETKNPYLEIGGSFVFDTHDKTKEEIDGMKLFQGIKIIDQEKEEYTLNFNINPTK